MSRGPPALLRVEVAQREDLRMMAWPVCTPRDCCRPQRRGVGHRKQNPSYSLWTSLSLLLTFLLQACWEGLEASCCHH